jgi:hypothetical protein
LANVKTDSWVAVERVEEGESKLVACEATKANLESLLKHDPNIDLDRLIQADSNDIIQFLTHLGFDNLDLKIKQYAAIQGISEDEARQEASHFIPLIGSVSQAQLEALKDLVCDAPDLLEGALNKARQKLLEKRSIEDNRVIGENIELIIRKIIRNKRLQAKRIRIGGDIEIWPDDTEGWDSGQLEISRYTIEVKFTSSSRVHISRVQSELARSKQENYIVLIVKNAGALRDRLKVTLEKNDISETIVNDMIKIRV